MYAIAAPSCVLPANVAENAQFLAHKVQEVGLCFFETKACLAYTEEDLPLHLQSLPLRWHIHLPVDLPWKVGSTLKGSHAAQKALALLTKVAYLRPRYAVLHPPTFLDDPVQQGLLLQEFLQTWHKVSSCPVLLENLQHMPLHTLPESLFQNVTHNKKQEFVFGICLDVGHMLAFEQEILIEKQALLDRVQLVHWSAPGNFDDHKPLSAFTVRQKNILMQLVPLLPQHCTHMVEVFHWQGIEESIPHLQKFLAHGGMKNGHKK